MIDYFLNIFFIFIIINMAFNGFKYEMYKFIFNFFAMIIIMYLWQDSEKIAVFNFLLFLIINFFILKYISKFKQSGYNEFFLGLIFSFFNFLIYLNLFNLILLSFDSNLNYEYANNFFVACVLKLSIYLYNFLR